MKLLLQFRKTANRLVIGASECDFGIEIEQTGDVGQSEETIADFFGDGTPAPSNDGRFELDDFFFHLFERGSGRRLIKPEMGNPLTDLKSG